MNPLAGYAGVLKDLLCAAIVAAVFIGGCHAGKSAGDREVLVMRTQNAEANARSARSTLAASEAARSEEQHRAEDVNRLAAAYEKGKANAKLEGDRVAAGLHAGNLRLRQLWQRCEARPAAGEVAADPGESDAEDGLRFASAGRIVGIVAACQAERDALLNLAEQDRAPVE